MTIDYRIDCAMVTEYEHVEISQQLWSRPKASAEWNGTPAGNDNRFLFITVSMLVP
jgi:hypothetical protein